MDADRILVTGGSGFIGGHLVDGLLARGMRVRCLLRPTSSRRFLPVDEIEEAEGRLEDVESLRRAAAGVDWIVHSAGITLSCREEEYFAVNRSGTANLLRAAAGAGGGLKGFIYLSSLAAGGPCRDGRPRTEDDPPAPVSCYGRSKLAGEEETRKYAATFPVTVFRPAAVYGPREREIFEIIRQVERGWEIHPGRKDIHLSMIYVTDLVEAVASAMKQNRKNWRLYYLADGNSYRSGELLALAGQLLGRRTIRVRPPLGAVSCVFRMLSRLQPDGRCAFYLDKVREMRHNYWLCDISRAKRELDFRPRFDLRRGLAAAIEWYRREGWINQPEQNP